MTIWAHTLVKNEERYLWFAVGSVAPYVDKVLLWDTGSTDNTVKIAKELTKRFPDKIDFKEVGNVDINQFTVVRQEMLERTKADWFLIVDGDEVWWDEQIKTMVDLIRDKGNSLDSIGCRFYNLVGDIFHFQDESAGKYTIDSRVGHLTIRAVSRKIKGLHFGKPHGQQGLLDADERLIQDRPPLGRYFIDQKTYLHFTHLKRSASGDVNVPKRMPKLKYELGKSFPLDFYYPEVFFKDKLDIVSSPWFTMDVYFRARSYIETPPRKLKRKLVKSRSGY